MIKQLLLLLAMLLITSSVTSQCEPNFPIKEEHQSFYNLLEKIDHETADSLDRITVANLLERIERVFGNHNTLYAQALQKAGKVEFYLYEDQKAIDFFNSSLNFWRSSQAEASTAAAYNIPRLETNIAVSLYYLQDYFGSLEQLKSVETFFEEAGLAEQYPRLYVNYLLTRARSLEEIGDLDNAMISYQKIIDFHKASSYGDCHESVDNAVLDGLNELGFMLTNESMNNERAAIVLEEAQQILENSAINQVARKQSNYNALGVLYTNQKRYDDAEKVLNKALNLAIAQNEPSDQFLAYTNLAYLNIQRGNFQKAEVFSKKALVLEEDALELGHIVNLLDNCTDIAFEKGNFAKALHLNKSGLEKLITDSISIEDLIKNQSVSFITDKRLFIDLLDSRGQIQAASGDLVSAFETFQFAAKLIDLTRQDFRPDISKGLLASKTRPVLERAINVCYELYQQSHEQLYAEAALLFSEQSRSLILYDAINNINASSLLPEDKAEAEKQLQLRLNAAEKKRYQEDGNTPENRSAVDQLRKELGKMRKQLFDKYPNYARAFKTKFRKSYAELKADMAMEKSYIEYFTTASVSYAFATEKDGDIQFIKLPGTKTSLANGQNLETLVQRIKSSLYNRDSEFLSAAHLVYKTYFQPLETAILHDELIIVPDGVLSYVSFDMLPTGLPTDINNFYYRDFSDYLIQQKTVSYQYSLSLDAAEKAEQTAEMKTFLGIAPDLKDSCFIRQTHFGPLKNNQQLIEDLANEYGRLAEIWKTGNPDQFIEEAGHFRIIQMVSHALANDQQGDLSFLLLGAEEALVLDAKDIYASRLPNTELVILGSCEGAIGELKTGEGVISLARSFFYAGAAAVIPTLWSVEESATEKITRLFHDNLIAGDNKNVALRKAKLEYINQLIKTDDPNAEFEAHPYYWAGQIPVGNMDAINGLQRSNWLYYALFSFVVIAALLLFLKKNEKK